MDKRFLGGRVIGLAVGVAVLGVAVGCDDAKKGASDAAAPKISAEPAAASATASASAAPAPVATVGVMVRIPGGSFMMGSSDGQPDEKPVRRVTVNAFEMDLHEVTVGAYALCAEAGKCTLGDVDHFCNWGRLGRENHPMNCLEWEQAGAYCASVGKRLPTEEEWEYAARGTDGRPYPWGKLPAPKELCVLRTQQGTCPAETVPVDSPFGLRGMAGNVWEWTSSAYSDDYGKKRSDPRKVYRGGSFYEETLEHMRATTRNRRPTNTRFDYLGFRCARTPGKAK